MLAALGVCVALFLATPVRAETQFAGFFNFTRLFALKARVACDRILTGSFRLRKQKSAEDQILRNLEKRFSAELGISVSRSRWLKAGQIQGRIWWGQVRGLTYNPEPGEKVMMFIKLEHYLEQLREIKRLTEAGVQFKFTRYGSVEIIGWVVNITPKGDDALVRWWANRRARHKLSYHFYSQFTSEENPGWYNDGSIYIAPAALENPELLREIIIHESIHGAQDRGRTHGDYTGTIKFFPFDFTSKIKPHTPLPDAPTGYASGLSSGEFECQYLGKTLGDRTNHRVAWAKARPFLIQLVWLRMLRDRIVESGTAAPANLWIVYRGVRINVAIERDTTVTDETQITEEILRTVNTRIRHLENIARVHDPGLLAELNRSSAKR